MRTTIAPAAVRSPLLLAGALAAPLFTVAVLAQAALRPGFDLTRHPASVLANGEHGWVQVATFLVTGALTLAGAAGMRRTVGDLRGPQGEASRAGLVGGRLVAGLLAVQGAGLIVAAIFKLDPVDGFPAGTPAGQPETFSTEAMVHNAAGSLSFLALIVACFVLARRIRGRWAVLGVVAGAAFAAGLVWALSGGAAGSLTLFLGVVVAWTWVAATEVRLAR
jgi:hypothetical protein